MTLDSFFGWFSDTGHAAVFAATLSLVAIAVSVWALLVNRGLQARLVQIEEERDRIAEKQSRKASLLAELMRNGSYYNLLIHNRGAGEARDISIRLDGKPFLEHSAIPRGVAAADCLGPMSSHRYPFAKTIDMLGTFHIEIAWSDDSGERGLYHSTLTA